MRTCESSFKDIPSLLWPHFFFYALTLYQLPNQLINTAGVGHLFNLQMSFMYVRLYMAPKKWRHPGGPHEFIGPRISLISWSESSMS